MPDEFDTPESPRPASDETLTQSEHQRHLSQRLSARATLMGANIPGYETLECLGEGAFGSVWLARERKTGRMVAIKFFTRQRGLDWALLTREVEKLAVLDASRDVVRLFDVGWDHDPPYFVMEYLEAGSVASVMSKGPIPVAQAVDITKSIARALVHAHGAGILHCDIKPGNVLLDRGGQARLGDFGQSRLTTELSPALGTLYYMAPEQAVLKGIPDARWDVYSLGALLFHMLTGDPPYRSPDAERRLEKTESLEDRLRNYREIIQGSPQPAAHRQVRGVDRELAEIVDACLQRDPLQRPPNAQVVLDLLDRRDLQRSRRPLIWLGILGPILLMLAVVWIASRAIPSAITTAGQNLYSRALASDAAAVKILAKSIEQEFADRQYELELLGEQITQIPGNTVDGLSPDCGAVLERWKAKTDERMSSQQRKADQSLFLTDASGVQRFRVTSDNTSDNTLNQPFWHRDYYHGQGRQLDKDKPRPAGLQPRTASGISSAFRSDATGQYMVVIAAPVWNADHSQVIGVLGRSIHLTDLLSKWEERIREGTSNAGEAAISEEDIFLSIIDMHVDAPMFLDHHWMTQENLAQYSERVEDSADDRRLKEFLALSKAEIEQFKNRDRSYNYADPLAARLKAIDDPNASKYEGVWLAAFSEVNQAGWLAIVQERRSRVVAPMLELYDVFLRYGLWTLMLFCIVLTALWWLIQRVSRAGLGMRV